MNRWKLAFFSLLAVLSTIIAIFLYWISDIEQSKPLPDLQVTPQMNNPTLSVQASKNDLEGMTNYYLRETMNDQPLPVTITFDDSVILQSEMTVFSFTLPVIMHFEPVVLEDGNLLLKQSKMEIGNLNLPPTTVLKVLRDAVAYPPWMVIRPKEEEIFINFSELPVSKQLKVKAKTFNLKEDKIEFEITIVQ